MADGTPTSGQRVRTAYRPLWQENPGYKTVVDDKSTKGILPSQLDSKTDTGQDRLDSAWPVAPGESREKERALPLPSNPGKEREIHVGPTYYNKNVTTPYRTKSVPGEQYGHPTKYDYNMPTRRDGVTATNPLPKKRQKNLSPAYKVVMRNWYKKNRSRKKLKERLKYRTKGKRDPQQKRFRKYYRQYPKRYQRRGLSPWSTPSERTKAWRKEQGQDAKRKNITPKEQEQRRKETPKKYRTRSPKTPGSTSRVYASLGGRQWTMLAANWPLDWNTQTKKTTPPEQLDQNYGKGQSRETGTPRTDPDKQKGESLRAPNLPAKHQPGLLTQHKPPASQMPSVEVNNPTSGSGKVIPLSYYTDIVNNTQQVPDGRQDRYLHNNNFDVKQASTMDEILRHADHEIRNKAQERPPKLVRTDTKNWIWHWKSGDHTVKVQAFQRGNAVNFNRLNLRISCSCPFWMWQGPEHWAKQGDYLLGHPRGSASRPTEKDPQHRHSVCKHVYAVLDRSKRFFVRPSEKPLRKFGTRFFADTTKAIEVRFVLEPSPARVAQAYSQQDLIRRVTTRYLAGGF